MEKLKSYSLKYKLGEEGEEELISLMNELMKGSSNSMDEIIKRTVEETLKMTKIEKKEEKCSKMKKYKSRKAEEYAEEHGIEITEFEMYEISKKDVENKIKEKTKMKNNNNEIKRETKESKKEENVQKRKVICSGINKKGEACKSTGTIKPEGAKKHYCFRHAEDWKSFECESDSSEEELEKEELEKEEIEKEELLEKSDE